MDIGVFSFNTEYSMRADHLAREAEARGCRVIDGLGMLINQGVIGIKYWTGIDADPGVMRRTLEEIFGT